MSTSRHRRTSALCLFHPFSDLSLSSWVSPLTLSSGFIVHIAWWTAGDESLLVKTKITAARRSNHHAYQNRLPRMRRWTLYNAIIMEIMLRQYHDLQNNECIRWQYCNVPCPHNALSWMTFSLSMLDKLYGNRLAPTPFAICSVYLGASWVYRLDNFRRQLQS